MMSHCHKQRVVGNVQAFGTGWAGRGGGARAVLHGTGTARAIWCHVATISLAQSSCAKIADTSLFFRDDLGQLA